MLNRTVRGECVAFPSIRLGRRDMDRWPGMVAAALVLGASASLAAGEPTDTETEQAQGLLKSVSQDVKERRANAEAHQAEIDLGIQELQQQFDTNDPAQRRRAIQKILATQDSRFIPILMELLNDPSAYNRRQAIYALYRLQAKGAADKIGALVSSDPDPQVQHQAAEYGTRLGYQSSKEEIEAFLTRDDFTSHSAAMHLSNSLPDEQEVELLASFLDHKSHHLRKRAVQRLARHDPSLIKPHAMSILRLAGDSDHWVRSAVAGAEEMLQKSITADDLRKLTERKSPCVQAMAYRMLRERGEDTSAEMVAHLTAEAPELRLEALLTFRAAGKGPEKEIVALLDDNDSGVRSYALSAMRSFRFPSAVPKLREIFATESSYHRKYAAQALLAMNESVWEPADPPKVEGSIFGAVAKLAKSDDKAAWDEVINGTDGIVNELAKLEAFPCKRDEMITGGHARRYDVIKQGEGRITERRCIGGNAPQRVQNAMLVHHGDLVIMGIIYDGIVIVTGNLYMHDGYVYDSIVLVQGDFVCGGYIKNSVVIAGEDNTLSMMDGHVGESVIAAGTIESGDSYTSESLYSGDMVSRSSQGVDLRNSRQFSAASVYKRLQKQFE